LAGARNILCEARETESKEKREAVFLAQESEGPVAPSRAVTGMPSTVAEAMIIEHHQGRQDGAATWGWAINCICLGRFPVMAWTL